MKSYVHENEWKTVFAALCAESHFLNASICRAIVDICVGTQSSSHILTSKKGAEETEKKK